MALCFGSPCRSDPLLLLVFQPKSNLFHFPRVVLSSVPPLKIMMICPKPQKDFRDPIIKTTFVAEENCGCQMGIMFNVKILKMILNLSRLLRLTQCLILSILPSIDFWSNQLLHWRQISVKGFAYSSCLNGTIPWRKCSVKVYLGKLTQKRIFLFVTLLI